MMVHSYCIIALFLILPLNCQDVYISDIRDQSHVIMKYVALTLFSILLLYGIIVNVLLLTVIYSRNSFYTRAFMLIVSQLAVCHLFMFLIQVVYILPELLKSKSISEGKLFYILHFIFLQQRFLDHSLIPN